MIPEVVAVPDASVITPNAPSTIVTRRASNCSSTKSAWPSLTRSAVAKCYIIQTWKVTSLFLSAELWVWTPSSINVILREHLAQTCLFSSGVKLKLDTMKCEQKKKRKSRLKNRASRRKNASKQQNYDASNSAGFQADQPTPQCRWEMSTSTTSTTTSEQRRPLCAILGSGDMFRVKNFDGVPYTQCPLADGAVPIIELPYLLVMGSIADQKLTKVKCLHVVVAVEEYLSGWMVKTSDFDLKRGDTIYKLRLQCVN